MTGKDPHLDQAVEALRVATLLQQQYMQDVRGLPTGSMVSMEQRLRAMDENFAGVWEKLDHAADLLERAGRDTARYRFIRAQVPETVQGYQELHDEQLTPGGIRQSTTWRVSQQRLTDLASALGALRHLVPGVQWEVNQDPEVSAYLAAQRNPLRWLKPLGVLCLVISGIGGVVAAIQWLRPPDYGVEARKIHKLEEQLEQEPCHKQRMVKLAEALNRAGAHRAVLERAEAFFKACGEHRRLRWATLTAHKKLGQWDAAIAEATLLVEAVPRDRDYRHWRGELYEAKGDHARALADYRQALALAPFLADVPVDLTELSDRLGRPCEALLWLGALVQHHPRNAKPVTPRLSRLRLRCTKLAGKGRALVPLVSAAEVPQQDAGTAPAADSGPPPARVTVNGVAVTSFEVKHDALYAMLSTELARRLGLDTGKAPRVIQRTPDGFFPSRLVVVKRLTAGAASAADVPVLVTARLPRGAHCVLGQSFLTRFSTTTANRRVLIQPFSNQIPPLVDQD